MTSEESVAEAIVHFIQHDLDEKGAGYWNVATKKQFAQRWRWVIVGILAVQEFNEEWNKNPPE